MKDNTGNEVMSALNETMCRQIAEAGKGAYIHVDNSNMAQKQLDNELTKLQKGEMSSVIYSEYDEQFQAVGIDHLRIGISLIDDEQFQAVGVLVILILLVEMLMLERKNPLLRRFKLFK